MMCKCQIGWTVDESVKGVHNSEPHTCREYIDALEQVVKAVDPHLLHTLQQEYGAPVSA